ncbi:hypothetical protein N8492_02355 [Synechococcus sp. AH-601-O06]|nr:hypothetical protein [Synechococcus sp. AH-601-O06]
MQSSLRLSLSLSGVAALALSNGALPAAAQEDGGALKKKRQSRFLVTTI